LSDLPFYGLRIGGQRLAAKRFRPRWGQYVELPGASFMLRAWPLPRGGRKLNRGLNLGCFSLEAVGAECRFEDSRESEFERILHRRLHPSNAWCLLRLHEEGCDLPPDVRSEGENGKRQSTSPRAI
jgi:hypothetical protein